MDTINLINEIENYEVIGKTRDILITYSLSDSTSLSNVENGSIIAREQGSDNYDLIVTTDLGEPLLKFKSLDLETIESLRGKTIVFGGISESTNDIEEALLVSKLTIEKINKIKVGRQ